MLLRNEAHERSDIGSARRIWEIGEREEPDEKAEGVSALTEM